MKEHLQPGDLVDVLIRGARVMDPKPGHDNTLTLGYAQTQPGVFATFDLTRPAAGSVNLTRVAPAEWPPIQADVWRDRDGVLWFVSRHEVGFEHPRTEIRYTPSNDRTGKTYYGPNDLLAERGPLTLVHREYPQDGDDL